MGLADVRRGIEPGAFRVEQTLSGERPVSEDVRVVALMQAKQGEESAVQQACEACVGPTRQEAGCDMYVLHRDSQNPSLLVFVEHWKSESALKQHMQTPHFKALTHALTGKLTQQMQVHVLQPV
jgi:quinol monooxygenase YgiN